MKGNLIIISGPSGVGKSNYCPYTSLQTKNIE